MSEVASDWLVSGVVVGDWVESASASCAGVLEVLGCAIVSL